MTTRRRRRVNMLLYFLLALGFVAAIFVGLRINPDSGPGLTAILALLLGEFAAVALVLREASRLNREDAERPPGADDFR